jgi:hypothetical protein
MHEANVEGSWAEVGLDKKARPYLKNKVKRKKG